MNIKVLSSTILILVLTGISGMAAAEETNFTDVINKKWAGHIPQIEQINASEPKYALNDFEDMHTYDINEADNASHGIIGASITALIILLFIYFKLK